MRRAAAIAAVAVVLAVAAPQAGAVPKTTFSAKTDGLPQPLVIGEWDETGTNLTVTGLAANGFASSYAAEWTSDPVKMTPNSPTLTLGGSFAFAQVLAGTLNQSFQFRFRFNAAKWTPWLNLGDAGAEVPMLTPVATPPGSLPIPLGKLFYRMCKGCKLTVGVRIGAHHSGTVAFRDTLSLSLR